MSFLKDCFHQNNDSVERQSGKDRRNKCFLIIYYIILFFYGLAILILSMLAEQVEHKLYDQVFQGLPYSYNDFIANWNQDPITDITVQQNGACQDGYEELFQLQQDNNLSLSNWWDGNKAFAICVKRLKGYSFAESYITEPKCDLNTQQLCGGSFTENKFCVPLGSNCPINDMMLINATQLSQVPKGQYQYTLKINSNLYLVASNMAEHLPISDVRITNGAAACQSSNSDYSVIFQGAFCGSNDIRFIEMDNIKIQDYEKANSLTTSQSGNSFVGLYKRNYITWTIQCRQKHLANKALNSQSHYTIMSQLQFILIVLSGVNFGFVGCIFGLFGLLSMLTESGMTKKGKICNHFVKQCMIIIKIIIQTCHAIIILLAFSYIIEQKIFVDRVIGMQCSDSTTLAIFNFVDTFVISSLYFYDSLIFYLFVILTILECLAGYVYLHTSIRTKKLKKYENLNESKIQDYSQINYQMNAGFQQQIQGQQTLGNPFKDNHYIQPQLTISQEVQMVTPMQPKKNSQSQFNYGTASQNQQSILNSTPKVTSNIISPTKQIIQIQNNNPTGPPPSQNQTQFVQFESFSGSSNTYQSQALGQRLESGQKPPQYYQTQQHEIIKEEPREDDRYQSQDLPHYKPKYYQE